jgi:transcription termination factor Rho
VLCLSNPSIESRQHAKHSELENKPLAELRTMAGDFNIQYQPHEEGISCVRLSGGSGIEGLEIRGGILETMNEGIGFLRSEHYQIGEDDVYVSQAQIRRYDLRDGDFVIGHVRPPRDSERHYGLLKVETVKDAQNAPHLPKFENLP